MPKVLVGNRLHLAFNRKVGERDAQMYANKHSMAFFEVSPLCNFNIHESFCELSRMALQRNGMERLWRSNKGNTQINHMVPALFNLFLFQCCPYKNYVVVQSLLEPQFTVLNSYHFLLVWNPILSRMRWRRLGLSCAIRIVSERGVNIRVLWARQHHLAARGAAVCPGTRARSHDVACVCVLWCKSLVDYFFYY